MLRFLYCAALRAHPRYFRERFAEEMQAIFDQAESPMAQAGLLADAVLSLLRQWTLRPEFLQERATAAPDGSVLLFSSLGNSKPRTVALLYGAILSALVLNGVSLTMGYAWEHPIFIEIRRPTIVPPAAWKARPKMQPVPAIPAEPSLYTDQGRVILIFNSPSHPAPSAQPAQPAPQGAAPNSETAPATVNTGVDTPVAVLQSYAGTYVAQAPGGQRVRVTIDNRQLQLEVVGEFRSALAPLPNPQLLACDVGDCWVMFSTSAKGTVDRIEIHHLGREILAYREQRGMVF
jgi:hypothetical protein